MAVTGSMPGLEKPRKSGDPSRMADLPTQDAKDVRQSNASSSPPPGLIADEITAETLRPNTGSVVISHPESPERSVSSPEHIPPRIITEMSTDNRVETSPQLGDTHVSADVPDGLPSADSLLYLNSMHQHESNPATGLSLVSSEQTMHGSQPEQIQPADPPTPEYQRPMTHMRERKILVEFEDMQHEREALSRDLVDEALAPLDMSRLAACEEILRRNEELAAKERDFLRKWCTELEKRERLLR